MAALAAFTAGLTVFGQSVNFVILTKYENFVQTGAGEENVTGRPSNPTYDLYPWRFVADMDGNSLSGSYPIPPNTVTTPAGSLVTSFNLAYDGEGHWDYRPGYATQASMDADLNNGIYSVALANGTASPFNLNLDGDLYPNKPVATLTGGIWENNVYQLKPASAWTLTTGLFSANFQDDLARVEIDIRGPGVGFNAAAGVASNNPFPGGDTGSLTISSGDAGAPTFVAGAIYVVDIRFNRVVDFQDISEALGQDPSTARGVAIYGSSVSFNIQAIPEPTTYAAWAGLLALGLVMWHRRRPA